MHFDFFQFTKNDAEGIEVWLKHNDVMGIPRRENHKLAKLKIGHPIRYKVNFKSDFTLSGGQERIFLEFDFVLEPGFDKDAVGSITLNLYSLSFSILSPV